MKSLLPLLTLACLVSCQTKTDDPAPAENPPAEEPAPAAVIDVKKPESLLGQRLEKVQAACDAADLPHRVIEVDGESRPVTKDFRPERLNFKVSAGLVTAVTNG
jgi:hypothetical protein